jgi:amidase
MSGEIDLNDLCRLSATAAVDLLRRREVSPLELLDASAARIAETDSILNAIPTLCLDRARDRAKALMRSPPADSAGHFLHGLPIVVKDNVEVQGVRCTFGSAIFADYVSPESDPVVQRLEANGALVVGKSNIPEFAAGGNTFNDMFGITRNPWNANYTPGGSSGGTAAALAAGQVWLGTGNDFGGSIRIPASFCSLVGLRPTPGTVPRVQKQPYSPLNVEGPLARSVMDCALMLECEAGRHPLDPLSAEIVPGSFMRAAAIPYRPKLAALSLDLGIAPTVASEVAGVFGLLGDKLAGAGCDVEAACPDLQDAIAIFRTLRGVSFAGNMRTLLEKERHRLKSDVIANAEFGLGLTIAEVVTAELAHGELVRRVARFFERFDVLICPTVLCPPVKVEERHVSELNGIRLGDYLGWLVMTCAISVTGCPVLALPCGFTRQGLPVGVQVIGPVGSDARLLAIGAFLEQVLDVSPRVPIATSASRSTVPRSAA